MSDIDYFAQDASLGEKMDPFTTNWFEPPNKHVDPPSPHRPSKVIPEADRLFAVQKALVKAINIMPGLGGKKDTPGHHELLDKAIMDAYRGVRNYLRDYGNPGTPGGGTLD